MVRGGLLSSLSDLLRCEPYADLTLGYTHPIAPPTWSDAARHCHLPGVMLVPMAFVGEAFVPNGATLVSMSGAGVGDVALRVCVLVVFGAYIAHLLWTTLRVRTVSVRYKEDAAEETGHLVRYWLHSPALLVPTGLTDETWTNPTPQQYTELMSYVSVKRNLMDASLPLDVSSGLQWMLWYAPYSDELNVMWFKAVELALGSAVNLIEGFVTDSCLVQGFAVLVMVGTVLVVMVVTRPLAVRAQQVTTTVVYGSMFVSSVVVVANLFAEQMRLEAAASVLLMVSTAATLLLSTIDVLISFVTVHALLGDLLRLLRKRWKASGSSPREEGTQRNMTLLELMSLGDGAGSVYSETRSVRETDGDGGTRAGDRRSELDERAMRDALLDELEELDREIEIQSRPYPREE